jgi:hypothetical protein
MIERGAPLLRETRNPRMTLEIGTASNGAAHPGASAYAGKFVG